MTTSLPHDETRRLQALLDTGILDTPPESAFDELTILAARICATPIALVSLVDARRQWFKSRHGTDTIETPRDQSMCAHALGQDHPLVVPDTTLDPRFAANPLVTSAPGLRFYAGAPLVLEEGVVLGTLCVIDHRPRELSAEQLDSLRILARQVVDEIRLRRHTRQLADSTLRLTNILESITDGFFALDTAWRFTYINGEGERLVRRNRAEILGASLWEVFPAAVGSTFEHAYRRAVAENRAQSFEEYYPPLGVWFDVRAYPSAEGLVIYFRDITARKSSEDALRLSEERFRLLAKATNDAIWDWDILTDAVWWNDGVETLFGFARAEIELDSRSWTTRIHPEDRDAIVRDIRAALNGSCATWSADYRFRRKDGGYALVHDCGHILRDPAGRALRMIGGMSDVTAARQAAARIAEQAALLDKAQDAILVRDLDHRILYLNRSAERLYGWPAADALGQSVKDLLYRDPAAFLAATATTLAEGEWVGEVEQITRSGHVITVESRWTLLRDERGAPRSILAINTDVTERKKLELQFMRAQRMESIGTLAGGIAHDLNNLLSPIIMGVDLLRIIEPNPRIAPVLDNIGRSAKRGTDLVKQVLSFARGVEGARVAIHLDHIVREIESIIENTFPKNIRFERTSASDLWLVVGDPTQLNQVLLNLCVNARDAMPEGGVLTATTRNVVLDQQFAVMNRGVAAGSYVLLEVADQGCGMPKEIIDRVFEPFFTTKEQGKGTGLGLSTVLGIVRSHGGFVNVYSEVGRGSVFKVYLPAQTDSTGPFEAATLCEALPHGQGECILVVDDEVSILTITKQTLESFGYKVLTADDGAQAIGVYAQNQALVDLVLTDMMMPVMDGPALIVALRRLNPNVRLIAASGLNANGNVAKAANAGVKHFLPKPYTADRLLTLLRVVLAEPV